MTRVCVLGTGGAGLVAAVAAARTALNHTLDYVKERTLRVEAG